MDDTGWMIPQLIIPVCWSMAPSIGYNTEPPCSVVSAPWVKGIVGIKVILGWRLAPANNIYCDALSIVLIYKYKPCSQGEIKNIFYSQEGGGAFVWNHHVGRKCINSIITKDYAHLGRGPAFSRRALTVRSLLCASAARSTFKKVIVFPLCGSTSPWSSDIVMGGRLHHISTNKCALALPQFKVKPPFPSTSLLHS